MKINCKKCNKELNKLNLSEEQKLHLYVLMQSNLQLFAKKKLMDEHVLTEYEAETIVQHLNVNNKCNECEFDELKDEYVECSKCHAFNYNLKEPSFNLDFCSILEWSLDFKNTGYEDAEYFWCDGISHLPKNTDSLLYENIEKYREIITKAWIGNDGQSIYEMIIKLGDLSVENYKNHKSLIDCIPTHSEKPNWIVLDIGNRKIEVQLK